MRRTDGLRANAYRVPSEVIPMDKKQDKPRVDQIDQLYDAVREYRSRIPRPKAAKYTSSASMATR